MKFKIDLHVHSKYSGDNDSDPEETIVRAIELGLQGIAFTEHDSFAASEAIEAFREKYGGSIRIFRGVEFSSAQGHCLVFGADPDKAGLRYASVHDLIRYVTKAGGVVIPSHPYRPGTSLGELIRTVKGISALEGYNGANMQPYNARAIEIASLLNLPYTGGSDSHAPGEVASCYTEFSEEVTYENFINMLKAGKFRGVDTRKISRMFKTAGERRSPAEE